MGKGQELYKRAKQIIPGGTQLLSKRPEMFLPDQWPAYYSAARGCEVTDLDGKTYIDVSLMGIGACILGYADDEINAAVQNAIAKGNMCTLNPPEEVELAELLLRLHPWAGSVRFQRCGGEAMAVAVRIARAYSKKEKILFCGYHGWHDWYLSANLSEDSALDGHLLPGLDPTGVPRSLKGISIPFDFNDIQGFIDICETNKDSIGVIVLESVRNSDPVPGFFETINRYAKEYHIPVVVDEITAGFRMNLGGAHLNYTIDPDLAVFAKAISNGFPMSAVIGKREVMEVAQSSFMSSTYWTDRLGPAAAVATIRKMERTGAQKKIMETGKRIQEGWTTLSKKHDLDLHVGSLFPLSHFDFLIKPLVNKTLFTQMMLERGYLASTSFYVSTAHTTDIVEGYFSACDEVFGIISRAISSDASEPLLKGPVCHSGFKRLN